MQACSNSIVNWLKFLQSCTKQSNCYNAIVSAFVSVSPESALHRYTCMIEDNTINQLSICIHMVLSDKVDFREFRYQGMMDHNICMQLTQHLGLENGRHFAGDIFMMTSLNGSIFRVTGHLCGKFTGHRWISHTKASEAELWCFLWSAPQ